MDINEVNRLAKKSKQKATVAGAVKTCFELMIFLNKLKISSLFFGFSILLSFITALFSAAEITLLIPLFKGIIQNDFEFIRDLPIYGNIVRLIPQWFETSHSLFLLTVLSLFVVSVVHNLFGYASNLTVHYQVRLASGKIRKEVFSRYLIFGKLFFDRSGTGTLNTILMSYTQAVSGQLKAFQSLIAQIFTLIAYSIMIVAISWKLTLVTFIIFPIMNFLSSIFISRIRTMSKSHVLSRSALDKKIFNILSCMPLVKANAMEEDEKKNFNEVSDKEVKEAWNIQKASELIAPIQNISTLAALLIVAFSLKLVISDVGSQHISSFLIFFFIVRKMVPGFNALNKFNLSLAKVSGSIPPLMDILENDTDKHIIKSGKQVFESFKDKIEFRSTYFSYYPSTPILKGINLSINKGETTAIVGSTGAGKSTLINLLLRFYECPVNSIYIDGIDIREYSLDSLRQRMALVSQDTMLLNDTLLTNISYGATKSKTSTQLEAAVEKSRLSKLIQSLPNKLETIIGERGVQLSGGERQRVSIARAILKDVDILLLDEATSSLDTKTEQLIQDSIQEALKDKTAIVIAHRLSTIKNADKIIVVEGGQVVEEGTFNSLIAIHGKFAEFWNAQKFF